MIGIVGDVRYAGLDAQPQPEVYVSHRHSEAVRSPGLFIVIRTKGEPTGVVPALRADHTLGEILRAALLPGDGKSGD